MRAVCLSCGASKWGSLTPCRECGVRPETVEDQARALLASEEELDDSALQALAEQVQAGEVPTFDPELVRVRIAELEAVPVAPLGWTLLVVSLPFAGLVLAVLAIVVCAG